MMDAINHKRKTGIQRKVAFIIFLSVFIVLSISIGAIYFFGFNLIRSEIGKQHIQLCNMLGIYINQAIKGEAEDAETYAIRPLWIDAVKEANSKYGKMDGKPIADAIIKMDKKWNEADKDSPLIKEYLENRISLSMKDIIHLRGNVAQLFITDKYGGLVASSDKTGDFYQADERWWREAYNSGKGKTYVGDVEFDESSGYWVISIAVPMKNRDSEIIGICKVSIDINRLFASLENFKMGSSGHAALVDRNGRILFHPSISVMSTMFADERYLKTILSRDSAYYIIKHPHSHKKDIFTAYLKIKPALFTNKDVCWFVFIDQDADETFKPLNNFIVYLCIVSGIMMVIALLLGHIFGNIIVKPIHELHAATEKIMDGDWDYKIDISTGDEIEQLADAFKTMVVTIRDKQKKLSVANDKLEGLLKNLEKKVEERTKVLTETQEATLNILEDLNETKDRLERSNKELMRLDQLKSDFVSTVSHELRTPLSIIKEGVSLVLDRITGDINEKQGKVLTTAKDNIDRLARIINELLDMSRIESGKLELKKEIIELTALIRKVASSFDHTVKNKGLELKLDIFEKEVMCYADPDKIFQVFTNLIGNAIKFTDKGYIKISCADKGQEVECSVSDTGVGISREDIPKVFDKFQQFGRLPGPGDRGTGLGLSITKGIIDLHRGKIRVESQPNIGTKFTFTLNKFSPTDFFKEHIKNEFGEAVSNNAFLSILLISEIPLADKNLQDRITKTLRQEKDSVMMSAHEAIVLLPECNKSCALVIKERVRKMLDEYIKSLGPQANPSIKLGLATYPDDARDEEGLIAKARADNKEVSNG